MDSQRLFPTMQQGAHTEATTAVLWASAHTLVEL
jgi:hypothetical protein